MLFTLNLQRMQNFPVKPQNIILHGGRTYNNIFSSSQKQRLATGFDTPSENTFANFLEWFLE